MDSIDEITKDVSRELKEREEAKKAAQDQQRRAGDSPDTNQQFEEARRDAEWDQVVEHVEGGGKVKG